MATEYTPTTDEVRGDYESMHDGGEPEFDRWLTGVIAQAKAEALEEAVAQLHLVAYPVAPGVWHKAIAVGLISARATAIRAAVSHPEPIEEAK